MFRNRIRSLKRVPQQKCGSPVRTSSLPQIGLRTGCSPKFDEPANGLKIVQSRKRPPETNWTEKHQISPIVPAMAFLIIASIVAFGLITFWTIVIHVAPAMAGSVSQQAKGNVRVQGGEHTDTLLNEAEADIDANRFADSEARLNG